MGSEHREAAQLRPATIAAKRASADPARRRRRSRGYPLPEGFDDASGTPIAVAAKRVLLTVRTRAEAARVLHTAINDLGGGVLPARLAGSNVIPVDVSLGCGEPHVVVVDPVSIASMRLAQHLPFLVQDALDIAGRCDVAALGRRTPPPELPTSERAGGVVTRAQVARRLTQTTPGDRICLLRLSSTRHPPDTVVGDDVLHAFDVLIRSYLREPDFSGRLDGTDFIVVLVSVSEQFATAQVSDLVSAWSTRSATTSVATGIATVDEAGALAALGVAAEAVRCAESYGLNRVHSSGSSDETGQSAAQP